VPDSTIAATAMFTGSTLLTRNTRDFEKVPQLSLLKI
jgi:predicted nucleic acid-binding protein